ncbi:MAG TPA: type II toxin-antitoxin system RelE/ParE family toxin, partial [Candidatus Acidoferrales bacterium]|nr:type II toxin-antitoxin system RelE/ParE family toxin [Candidatus Acidoferrales bacterium]
MAYALRFHPRVLDEDKRKLSARQWARIARAVETRLPDEPERYSEPLAGSLRGYCKLRVGDHRVIFALVGTDLVIVGIMHRREVYE